MRRHGIALDSWDQYREENGFIVLSWVEPALRLAIVAVLGPAEYTLEIARRRETGVAGLTLSTQSAKVSSAYHHECADLTMVVGEILAYRAGVKPTVKSGEKKDAEVSHDATTELANAGSIIPLRPRPSNRSQTKSSQ